MCFGNTVARHRLQRCRDHHLELQVLRNKLYGALTLHDNQILFVGGHTTSDAVERLHIRLRDVTASLCALETIIDTSDAAHFLSETKASLKAMVQQSQTMIRETQKELPGLLDDLQDTQAAVVELTTTDHSFGMRCDDEKTFFLPEKNSQSLLSRDCGEIVQGRSASPQSPVPTLRRRTPAAAAN